MSFGLRSFAIGAGRTLSATARSVAGKNGARCGKRSLTSFRPHIILLIEADLNSRQEQNDVRAKSILMIGYKTQVAHSDSYFIQSTCQGLESVMNFNKAISGPLAICDRL